MANKGKNYCNIPDAEIISVEKIIDSFGKKFFVKASELWDCEDKQQTLGGKNEGYVCKGPGRTKWIIKATNNLLGELKATILANDLEHRTQYGAKVLLIDGDRICAKDIPNNQTEEDLQHALQIMHPAIAVQMFEFGNVKQFKSLFDNSPWGKARGSRPS